MLSITSRELWLIFWKCKVCKTWNFTNATVASFTMRQSPFQKYSLWYNKKLYFQELSELLWYTYTTIRRWKMELIDSKSFWIFWTRLLVTFNSNLEFPFWCRKRKWPLKLNNNFAFHTNELWIPLLCFYKLVLHTLTQLFINSTNNLKALTTFLQ